MNSSEVKKALLRNGWVHVRTKGSHWIFKNPQSDKIAVVPHPKRDLPIGTVKKLERDTGIKLLR
jgi:predicted RNA binding protein YcfA (HicA-like mRNA interferase family)